MKKTLLTWVLIISACQHISTPKNSKIPEEILDLFINDEWDHRLNIAIKYTLQMRSFSDSVYIIDSIPTIGYGQINPSVSIINEKTARDNYYKWMYKQSAKLKKEYHGFSPEQIAAMSSVCHSYGYSGAKKNGIIDKTGINREKLLIKSTYKGLIHYKTLEERIFTLWIYNNYNLMPSKKYYEIK